MLAVSFAFLQMLYDADGNILPPVILHNNSIPDDILELYDNYIHFYENPDGNMDSVTLEKMILLLSSYVHSQSIFCWFLTDMIVLF